MSKFTWTYAVFSRYGCDLNISTQTVILREKIFTIKFRLPKFGLISTRRQMKQVFSALGFAKCLQVSFLHPAIPVVVLTYAFAVFVEFVLNLCRQQFANFLPRFFSDCFCSFVGGCLHHIFCSAFECFADSHKSVTDQARPLVFISIPSDVFVKNFCPLTRVIHGVY